MEYNLHGYTISCNCVKVERGLSEFWVSVLAIAFGVYFGTEVSYFQKPCTGLI